MLELSVMRSCPVCLETINESKEYTTTCNHVFCRGCVLKIAKNEHDIVLKCPLCRSIFILTGLNNKELNNIEYPVTEIGKISLISISFYHIIMFGLGLYSIFIFVEYLNFVMNFVPNLCGKVNYCPLKDCYPVVIEQFIFSLILNCLVFTNDILSSTLSIIRCLNNILKRNFQYIIILNEIKTSITIYIIQLILAVLQIVTLPIFSWNIITPDSCTETFNHILFLISIYIGIKTTLTLISPLVYLCIK